MNPANRLTAQTTNAQRAQHQRVLRPLSVCRGYTPMSCPRRLTLWSVLERRCRSLAVVAIPDVTPVAFDEGIAAIGIIGLQGEGYETLGVVVKVIKYLRAKVMIRCDAAKGVD